MSGNVPTAFSGPLDTAQAVEVLALAECGRKPGTLAERPDLDAMEPVYVVGRVNAEKAIADLYARGFRLVRL